MTVIRDLRSALVIALGVALGLWLGNILYDATLHLIDLNTWPAPGEY